MDKCKSCFVIASNKAAALELASGAAQFAEKVSLISLSAPMSAAGIDTVYCLEDASVSVAMYTKSIAKLIAEQQPELVLVEQCRNGRLLAGVIAATLGTSVQSDISELSYDGAFVSKRAGYGGLAVKVERSAQTAVVCAGVGTFPAAAEAECGETLTIKADEQCGVSFVEKTEKVQQRTNLSAAKAVVCVGRGIGDTENLAVAEELANLIGAEMGCTRPVAEEDKLMPSNRYIGVSGVNIKPELYIAVGLSGQVQHTSGVNDAGCVLAINKDENAPIFSECDFGVVGDLKAVLPKVIELLRTK